MNFYEKAYDVFAKLLWVAFLSCGLFWWLRFMVEAMRARGYF